MAIIIFISLIIFLFGLYMINKTGNYENIWGALTLGGGLFTLIFSLISIIKFFIVLI